MIAPALSRMQVILCSINTSLPPAELKEGLRGDRYSTALPRCLLGTTFQEPHASRKIYKLHPGPSANPLRSWELVLLLTVSIPSR